MALSTTSNPIVKKKKTRKANKKIVEEIKKLAENSEVVIPKIKEFKETLACPRCKRPEYIKKIAGLESKNYRCNFCGLRDDIESFMEN